MMSRHTLAALVVITVIFHVDSQGEDHTVENFDEPKEENKIRHSSYVIKRKLRALEDDRIYNSLLKDSILDQRQRVRRKRDILKRARRSMIVRCCGGGTCDVTESRPNAENNKLGRNSTRPGGRRKVNYEVLGYNPLNNQLFIKKKKNPNGGTRYTALAKMVRGGLSVSCRNCPENWQNELRLKNKVGTVGIKCPGCPPNWRDFLPEEFQTGTTPKSDQEEFTDGETDDEDGDDKNETTTEDLSGEIEIVTEIIEVDESDNSTSVDADSPDAESSTEAEESTTEESTTESTTEAATTAAQTRPTRPPVATTTVATTTVATTAATTAKAPALPAGVTLPAGMTLPAGFKMPANLPANLPAGLPAKLPEGFNLAALLG